MIINSKLFTNEDKLKFWSVFNVHYSFAKSNVKNKKISIEILQTLTIVWLVSISMCCNFVIHLHMS